MAFDPYRKWMGIRAAADGQPPHHYRLLGLELYEDDPEVIESAADQRMTLLRTKQAGEHGAFAQQLLNEVAAARLCLLNRERKAAYDADLRHQLATAPGAGTAGQSPGQLAEYVPSDEFAVAPSPRPGKKRQPQTSPALVWGSVAAGVIVVVIVAAIAMWPKGQSRPEVVDVEETPAAIEEDNPPDDGPVVPLEEFHGRALPREKQDAGGSVAATPVSTGSSTPPTSATSAPDGKNGLANNSARFAVEIPGFDRGKWLLDQDELIQTSVDTSGFILFGDSKWDEFDYSVEVRRTSGPLSVGLLFHYQVGQGWDDYMTSCRRNLQLVSSYHDRQLTELETRELSLDQDAWHRLEIRVRGKTGSCFLDGQQVLSFQSPLRSDGKIGLATIGSACRFRNILVKTPEGKVLLEGLPDLGRASSASSAPPTASGNGSDGKGGQPNRPARFAVEIPDKDRGKWSLDGNELVQSAFDNNVGIFFGNPEWENFDYSIEAKRTAGHGGTGLWFHYNGDGEAEVYTPGFLRTSHCVQSFAQGHPTVLSTVPGALPENTWHRVEVRVRGKTGRCFLNGEEVLRFSSPRAARGRIGLRTTQTNYRFRNILVKTPDGKVLLEGLPDLDGAPTNRNTALAPTSPQIGNESPADGSDPPANPIDERAAPKGGEFAGRTKGGRLAAVKSGDATSGSEAAVQSGLKWLAKHQDNDGSWSFRIGAESANAIDNRMGATGLALLAFLGAGNTHKQGDYTKTVKGGLTYLISNMKVTSSGGDLRGGAGHHGMYSHGICTTALCEAYTMSNDKDLKQPAQLAIDFIVSAQHAGGGWRYEPGQAGDTSVTGWQMMALKTAKIAKLKGPGTTLGKVIAFLNAVQTDGGAQYGYDKAGAGPATNAIGLLSRIYLGWTPKQQALASGVGILSKMGPQPNNIYYNFYATQVLHHWGGEEWKKWNLAMREQLVKAQDKQGDTAGSWPPDQWGKTYGGRLFTTCLAIMTLEVYYRHQPLFQRLGTPPPEFPSEENANSTPVSIDLLQIRPESITADGGIHWEQDHLRLDGEGTVAYQIPDGVNRFTAEVILNTPGMATFFVYVGDEIKFQNNRVTQGEPVKIDVPIEPRRRVLKLITRLNGSKESAQAVWFEPRLTGSQSGTAPTRDPLNALSATPLFVQADDIDWTRQTMRTSLAGASRIQYHIPEGAKRFLATNAVHGSGTVRFAVILDGETAFRSDEISKVKRAQIDIPIKPGSKILELCTDPDAKDSGHGVWTNPHFDR